MQLKDLLVSNLTISEDNYSFKGTFTLSGGDKSISVDVEGIQSKADIERIKEYFMLEEPADTVRKVLMEQVIKNSAISSKICEGENYEESAKEKVIEKAAKYFDIA